MEHHGATAVVLSQGARCHTQRDKCGRQYGDKGEVSREGRAHQGELRHGNNTRRRSTRARVLRPTREELVHGRGHHYANVKWGAGCGSTEGPPTREAAMTEARGTSTEGRCMAAHVLYTWTPSRWLGALTPGEKWGRWECSSEISAHKHGEYPATNKRDGGT